MLFTNEAFVAAEAAYRQDRIRAQFPSRPRRERGRRRSLSGRRGLHRRHPAATSA